MDQIPRLLKGELIGKELRLIRDSDGMTLTAKIIDETKNTLVITADNKKKRISKALHTLEFDGGEKLIRISGKLFLKRPEERIKSKLMKRW
jgi:RNase P/RNase MRP subunit p29